MPGELALRFHSDAVVRGASNPLLAAEAALGRSHRNVPEQKLFLFLAIRHGILDRRTMMARSRDGWRIAHSLW